MKFLSLICALLLFGCSVVPNTQRVNRNSGPASYAEKFTADILRGSNTEFRDWWNVLYYNIVLTPDFNRRFVSGTVSIQFEITKESAHKIMQVDLQHPMKIKEIVQLAKKPNHDNLIKEFALNEKSWQRKENSYFIDTKELPVKDNEELVLKLYFEGHPRIAKNAPWDGGWIFTTDDFGRPWMSAAVQGLGASSWFPNKDYQGDEPDNGMIFSVIVPDELVAVANGQMWKSSFVKGDPGTNVYTWEVVNPINNYAIIPYIGHYTSFTDQFAGMEGILPIEYWVLDYNLDKAKSHFEQVKPMLTAFEDWMGPYPFYEDGFKMVESPYLGMEHQSAIAYGNGYFNGYLGHDRTNSGWGNKFDFIIVHETGHEWFGNSITSQDIADLWIHEAFTTYSEAMYVENLHGKQAANEYLQGLKPLIENVRNIIGNSYGTHSSGSRDMYYKGALMIHTLRQLMDDDIKFKQMIRDMNRLYFQKTVTSAEIENYISAYTGINLEQFFDQYLRSVKIPTLEIKNSNGQPYFRWINIVEGFDMPVKLKNSEDWIFPKKEWQLYSGETDLIPDQNFYVFLN